MTGGRGAVGAFQWNVLRARKQYLAFATRRKRHRELAPARCRPCDELYRSLNGVRREIEVRKISQLRTQFDAPKTGRQRT
jgi:hypothetical protein